MQLTVLASSSKANGYLLHNQKEALVIEAGVSLLQVKKALDFRLGLIRGCVVSHRHKDHARYVKQYADAAIDVLGPEGVFDSSHNRFHPILQGKTYILGGFRVSPFEVAHDAFCYGYIIDHFATGRILFLTDTWVCEYTFPDLRHILIEANYADDILEGNILKGIEYPSKRERLLTTHMELQTTKAILNAQDLSRVQHIILIHLSDNNSHEQRFIEEITTLTGISTKAAKAGYVVDMGAEPF